MSGEVRRAGDRIEVEFVDAEIVECYGSRDGRYGSGVMVLDLDEALRLAKEILEALLEVADEDHETEN